MTEAQIAETKQVLSMICQTCPNPVLIGFGGSIAYGTSTDTSDVDIRGIYVNPIEEFIGMQADSEQFKPDGYDCVIYSIKKMFKLLADCNPNTIELLGLTPDQILLCSGAGQDIYNSAKLFLSKKAGDSFGCYARAQLNRLTNKLGRTDSNSIVDNETRSISNAITALRKKDGIQGLSAQNDNGTLFITVNGHYSIDKFCRLTGEISNIHNDYKRSVRNDKAIVHGKIGKHMMHLVRLYLMGIDILKDQRITTLRPEHDLLMDVRNGRYFEDDQVTPNAAFNKLVQELSKEFDAALKSSTLPDTPDMTKINALMMECVKQELGISIDPNMQL